MSRRSWRVSINRSIRTVRATKGVLRVAVLGVGNELNGDDAAGLLAIRSLRKFHLPAERFLVLETGLAPENFTAAVIRFAPTWVLVVDAARVGLPPGRVAWLEMDELDGVGVATHGLPLSMVGRYLAAQTGCYCSVLGIQVGQTAFDHALTPAVRLAATRVGRTLGQFFSESEGSLRTGQAGTDVG